MQQQRSRNNSKRSAGRPTGQTSNRNRDEESLYLTPRNIGLLGNIALDERISKVLSDSNARISIVISAGGTEVELVSRTDGRTVGKIEDLTRIGGVNNFVNKQQREVVADSAMEEIHTMVYNLTNLIRQDDPAWKPGPVPQDLPRYLRDFNRKMAVVDSNVEELKKLPPSPNNSECLAYLRLMCARIEDAYGRFAMSFLKQGESRKDALTEQLLSSGVPRWVHAKLTGQKLDLRPESDARRILFPLKAYNGFALSIKEWRSPSIQAPLGPLLDCSDWLIKLVSQDDFLRDLAGIDAAIDLGDGSIPKVGELMSSSIHVIPKFGSLAFAYEPGQKNKMEGFSPSPKFNGTVKQSVRSLSEAILRPMLGIIESGDVISSYWKKLYPSFKIEGAITMKNNLFSLAVAQEQDLGPIYAEFVTLSNYVHRQLFVDIVTEFTRLPRAGPIIMAFNRVLGIPKTEKTPVKVQASYSTPQPWAEPTKDKYLWFETVNTKTDDGEYLAKLEKFVRTTFPKSKGKITKSRKLALSSLGRDSANLLRQIEKDSSARALGSAMDAWLRGFSSEEIQNAAAKLVLSSFDAIFYKDGRVFGDGSEDDEAYDDSEAE